MIEASKAAVRNGCFTSTPVVPSAGTKRWILSIKPIAPRDAPRRGLNNRDRALRLLRGPNLQQGAFSVPALRNRPLATNAPAAQPERRLHMGAYDEARRCLASPAAHPSLLARRATRAPQPELPPHNRHGHLIEMPARRWPRASTANFSDEQWPELQNPSLHRVVGDIQPTLNEQIFDVAMAEREVHLEPNGVPNDRRRELMAGGRNRHSPSYISRQTKNAPPFAKARWRSELRFIDARRLGRVLSRSR